MQLKFHVQYEMLSRKIWVRKNAFVNEIARWSRAANIYKRKLKFIADSDDKSVALMQFNIKIVQTLNSSSQKETGTIRIY